MSDPPTPTQDEADALKEAAHGVASMPPVNVDVPVVTGNGVVGEELTVTMGNWSGEPTSYAEAWFSDGSTQVGVGNRYQIQASDSGHDIDCVVTAGNAAGSTAAPRSNAIHVA